MVMASTSGISTSLSLLSWNWVSVVQPSIRLIICTLPWKRNMRAKYGDEASRTLLCVANRWPSQMTVKSIVS
jgi:hypothetical protein